MDLEEIESKQIPISVKISGASNKDGNFTIKDINTKIVAINDDIIQTEPIHLYFIEDEDRPNFWLECNEKGKVIDSKTYGISKILDHSNPASPSNKFISNIPLKIMNEECNTGCKIKIIGSETNNSGLVNTTEIKTIVDSINNDILKTAEVTLYFTPDKRNKGSWEQCNVSGIVSDIKSYNIFDKSISSSMTLSDLKDCNKCSITIKNSSQEINTNVKSINNDIVEISPVSLYFKETERGKWSECDKDGKEIVKNKYSILRASSKSPLTYAKSFFGYGGKSNKRKNKKRIQKRKTKRK